MHDDAAYVPRRRCTSAGPSQDPVRRFEAWMREHAELADDELGALEHDVEEAIARGGRRAPRRAPGPIRTRSRMASTPAEEERGQQPLSLPRYRPWFYDLVRVTSALLLHTVFRLTADGPRERAARRAASCSRRCTAPTSTRSPSACRSRSRRFRAMAKYELFLVPRGRPRDRARRRLPGSPRRAGHGGLRGRAAACCATATCCSSSPRARATATARRDRSWAPRGSRSRRAWRSCPSRSRGSDRIKLLPPRFPQDPRALRRADPARRSAGRRSAPRVVRGDEALVRGDRRGPREPRASAQQLAQAARWSIRRWRCSCSQAWCQARTRAA